MTTILLTRHGETDWNRERRWQGHADPPLNDVGRRQARSLAESLTAKPIDALYSSDLSRARETAEIVGERIGLPVRLDPRLREVDVGEWSGLTTSQVEQLFPAGLERRRAGGTGWERGEAYEAMATRVVAALHEIAGFSSRRSSDRGHPRRPDVLGLGRRRARPGGLAAHHELRPGRNRRRERAGSDGYTQYAVEDYTNKYKGEQVEVALFGGEYQDGVLTAYCYVEDVAHIELNGHILIPLQNIASLHCSSRCDAPEPDWPPQGLAEDEPDERDDEA